MGRGKGGGGGGEGGEREGEGRKGFFCGAKSLRLLKKEEEKKKKSSLKSNFYVQAKHVFGAVSSS